MLYAIMGFMLGYGMGQVALTWQIEKWEPGTMQKVKTLADEEKKKEAMK